MSELKRSLEKCLAKRREIQARWKKAMENPLSEDEFVSLVNSVNASGEIPEEYVVAFKLGGTTVSFRFVEKASGVVKRSPSPSWTGGGVIGLSLALSFSEFAKRHGWTIKQTPGRLFTVHFDKFDALMF